jgi:hypothetical protein
MSAAGERLAAELTAAQRLELDRILLRARADAPYMRETLGTGAPSTVKRAAAVRMALDGAETPAIASAGGLGPARVEQVLENVSAAGFAALYPAYAEDVPLPETIAGGKAGISSELQLWEVLHGLLAKPPYEAGARGAVWTPATLLDFLVDRGTLEDGSVRTIAGIIKRSMDPEEKSRGLTFDFDGTDTKSGKPSKPAKAWVGLLIMAGMLAFVVALGLRSVLVIGFLGLLVLLMTLSTLKELQEWWLLRKVLAPKSAAGLAPAATVQPTRGNTLPLPEFEIVHALALPDAGWETDALTADRNALGLAPLRVLYLWVFAAQEEQRVF